jgi:hypothetical protein
MSQIWARTRLQQSMAQQRRGLQTAVFTRNVVSSNVLVLQSNSPLSTFSTWTVSFRSVPVAVASSAQDISVSNRGGATLTLNGISIAGANSGDFSETDDCPAILDSGAHCTVHVIFTPTASGARSASLAVASNSVGGSQTIDLSGSGVDIAVSVAPGAAATRTVKAGQTATYNLQITASGAATVTDQASVSVTCSGAPSLSTCTVPTDAIVTTVETPGTFQISVKTTGLARSAYNVTTGNGRGAVVGLASVFGASV